MNDRPDVLNRPRALGLLVGILLFLLLPLNAPCRETGEAPLLDQALEHVGLDRKDIHIRADLSESVLALSLFQKWIEAPLEAPREAQDVATGLLQACSRPYFFLRALALPADIECPSFVKADLCPNITLPADLPEELAPAVGLLLDAFRRAEEILSPLMTKVSQEELSLLEKTFYPEAASKAKRDEGTEGLPKTQEMKDALRVATKIDRKAILKAALIITEALERTVNILVRVDSWEGTVSTISFMTPAGLVKIGGTGPDRHQERAALIIDLGGDDTYQGEVASGRDGQCALVIDLDGDDNYLGNDFTQGAGFRGIGILWDLKGDDLYRAGRCSQGAGLFGVGLLIDGSGFDTYLGESFVQAASLWGWGGLVDLEGEDSYLCGHSGQAYAEVMGVSCLSDLQGNDKYLSGSGVPDRREPGMNQSFSQGFAVGIRDRVAGGFALLADGSGNDHYQCGYFGQGSSYWMAVGMLYDERGTDTFVARRYAQGAGIHFSLGLLLDAEGNDHTFSWGVSQGCGHDYGIGLLVNESGDDTYVSGWLCMGASEANGIGLFLDNAGDDGYDNTQGMAVGRLIQNRRAGGPGIFVDAGGRDRYSGPGNDDSVWGSNRWSIGMDGKQTPSGGVHLSSPEGPPPPNKTAEKEKREERDKLTKRLSRAEALPTREKVGQLLSVASHWGHERAIPKQAGKSLLAVDPVDSAPVILSFLDTPNILSLIYMGTFFSVHAYTAFPLLLEKAENPDTRIHSRALHYLGGLRDTRALPSCIKGLEHASWKVRASATGAVGKILDKKRLKDLVPLKKILDTARKESTLALIEDYLRKTPNAPKILSILTRAAPMDYQTYRRLAEPPTEGKDEWEDDFSHVLFKYRNETAALLEKWIKDIQEDQIIAPRIEQCLLDPDPGVRQAAAYSIGQLEYTPGIARLLSLLNDPDPWVRDAAVLALARFGDAVVGPLASKMEAGDSLFKILGLDILGSIDSAASRAVQERYVHDPHAGVRRAAGQAMKH